MSRFVSEVNRIAMENQRTSFILSALDPDLDCPWLQIRFETDDFEKLCQCAVIDLERDRNLIEAIYLRRQRSQPYVKRLRLNSSTVHVKHFFASTRDTAMTSLT